MDDPADGRIQKLHESGASFRFSERKRKGIVPDLGEMFTAENGDTADGMLLQPRDQCFRDATFIHQQNPRGPGGRRDVRQSRQRRPLQFIE